MYSFSGWHCKKIICKKKLEENKTAKLHGVCFSFPYQSPGYIVWGYRAPNLAVHLLGRHLEEAVGIELCQLGVAEPLQEIAHQCPWHGGETDTAWRH